MPKGNQKRDDSSTPLSILLRYLILVLVAIPNLAIFYIIFERLTVFPVFYLLGLIFNVELFGRLILFSDYNLIIEIIDACIAGAAYYLLFIFNMAVPHVRTVKRLGMIAFSFIVFLFVNILRIVFLAGMAVSGSSYFDVTHKFFWYFISVIMVVGIWFLNVNIFKIRGVPFISDLKYLYKNSSFKK